MQSEEVNKVEMHYQFSRLYCKVGQTLLKTEERITKWGIAAVGIPSLILDKVFLQSYCNSVCSCK